LKTKNYAPGLKREGVTDQASPFPRRHGLEWSVAFLMDDQAAFIKPIGMTAGKDRHFGR
jgi:hypothetical protein